MHPSLQPNVAIFATCLVDLFRPSVGFAAVKLLEQAGCQVSVPRKQTCCGQPAWNSGEKTDTKAIAKQVIETFSPFDYVVLPSGSCAGMMKRHYVEVLDGEPIWQARALAFAGKVHELVSFLTDTLGVDAVSATLEGTATYHDSCAGLRELGIADQPRKLLATVKGLELVELEESNVCCGFGGAFSIKYPNLSNAIVTAKTKHVDNTGARYLIAGDLGCLINIAGKLSREGSTIEVRHVAEVLAGMTDNAPIGGPRKPGPR